MSKILVTGGAGFIGRSCVAKLIKNDHSVEIYDNFSLSSPLNRFFHCWNSDIRDMDSLEIALQEKDQVLHLAAPSSMLMYLENPISATTITIDGFLKLLEACRKRDVTNIVFASTSAIYEGLEPPWREDMVPHYKPQDLKSLSKYVCSQLAQLYSDKYGMKITALRPSSVYGVGEESKKGYANVVSLFCWAMSKGERPIVWGDGSQSRDFIYVEDVADLIVSVMNYNRMRSGNGFQVFNVGTGVSTTFNDVICIINSMLDKKLDPIYIPKPNQVDLYSPCVLTDMTRVKETFNWSHRITVEEGVRRILDYSKFLPDEVGKYQEVYSE